MNKATTVPTLRLHPRLSKWSYLAFAIAACWYCIATKVTFAQASSAPAILQIYEARWDVIEDRLADIHTTGYGRLWLPPPSRAGGGFSVGYDVFDRFDLGAPRNETHYGTESSFATLVDQSNTAAVDVYTDFIINHNGFGTRHDSNFVAQGGYPGFALTLPNDINGDFHDPSINADTDPLQGQISTLNDIAQEKNHLFIRHPIDASNPNNIPAGTQFNIPNPENTRFYTDQDAGGISVFDPQLNQTVTLYDFNSNDSGAGDPIIENAMGLLMRNARWMIQEFGVKGFRVDAAKHSPVFAHEHIDQALFRAIRELQHDGSIQPTYMFGETYDGNAGFVQQYIRRDLPNPVAIDPSNTTVGGNRDALDFPLFFAMRDNLTDNGLNNNWHNIRGASQDANDRPNGSPEWHTDGSQGVAFVRSHDDFGPALENVAYAYTLMRPGNAIVYFNAEQFGPTGFPKAGKVDALGGFYGETITKLVEVRNTHGRGDFQERWIDQAFDTNGFSNIYVYERENSALVALNSRNDSFVETRNGVQTAFAPGTVLVELTGNAADSTVDPGGAIPEAIRVNASGQVDVSIPSNDGHGRGYVIYGLATPQGSLTVTGATSTLAGTTPNAGNNGTARLEDIDVVTGDTFSVRLDTTPVTLPAPAGESQPVRDVHADGDTALIKIDEGMDLNNSGGIDTVTPGDIAYGFESFTDTHSPGYVFDGQSNIGTGTGTYEQSIDTTTLSEGRHYVTVRAFRHRNAGTGGDGGPAVFSDFRRTIYVDRLPPESEVVQFEPFASDPGNPDNRDLVLGSVDKTADNMHVFLDLAASLTDAEVLQLIGNGSETEHYDRDQRIRGYLGVTSGNHVVTVVTFEPTGNFNVQRFAGISTDTNIGAGLGDLDADGLIRGDDLLRTGGFRQVLYSQNTEFNAAADVDANGVIDTYDLVGLGNVLLAASVETLVLDLYEGLLADRGDFDESGETNTDDLVAIYASLGATDNWALDLDVDGVVDLDDAQMLVVDLLRTSPADFNLDGIVNLADYTVWRDQVGSQSGIGDADFDGDVDAADYQVWKSQFGFQRTPLAPPAAAFAAIPEPTSVVMLLTALSLCARTRR